MCPATRKERKGKIEIPSGRDFSALQGGTTGRDFSVESYR